MESNDSENDNMTVVIVVVVVAVVLLVTIIAALWWYHRKTGRLLRPCKRKPPSVNHTLNRSTLNHSNRNVESQQSVGAGYRADYRNPTPQNLKRVYSISERISEHLHEASEKMSRSEETVKDQNESPIRKNLKVSRKMSRSVSHDAMLDGRVRGMQRSVHSYSGDIGHYQDRTLPATLMMTPESKKQKFENEDTVALKRCNSDTHSFSSGGKTSKNPNSSKRPDSSRLQMYNDFGPGVQIKPYKVKRKVRKASNLSSHFSSKPSYTSDYVSDVETVTDGYRTWKTNDIFAQLHGGGRSSHYSECDSVLQESFSLKQSNPTGKSKLGFQPIVPSIDVFHVESEFDQERSSEMRILGLEGKLFDERTESQQNTMRADAFNRNYQYGYPFDEERSCADGQSSDTESMAGSGKASAFETIKRRKPRKCASENELSTRENSERARIKGRKKSRRSQSGSQESELRRTSNINKRRNRNLSLTSSERKAHGKVNLAFEDVKSHQAEEDYANIESDRRETFDKNRNGSKRSIKSGSIKTKQNKDGGGGGTVVEMPIYSRATWSGPGKTKPKKKYVRKAISSKNEPKNPPPLSKKTRASKKAVKTGRKLSIGGGGQYFCEYGSLPVDFNKLPKGLMIKLGGQTDKLLEPIEQLNFEQMFRPLPNLDNSELQLSARRLVVDHLPPDHRDRKLFSNTYKYEDTGLVMTDL